MKSALANAAPDTVVAEYQTEVITHETLKRYAAASGDSNPLHLEPAFARQAGFDDVIVHGMLGMALLGRLLTEQFPMHPIRSFSARFGGIIPVGHALRCRARLSERSATEVNLTLEAQVLGSDHVAISGSASLALDHAH